MSNTKETWEEVLTKLEGLGLKLKYHLESELADDDAEDAAEAAEDAAEAAAEGGEGARSSEMQSLMDGVEKFVDMIDDAFDAFGSAAKDDAVRSDMRDIGESLRNALAATWNDAGADLRDVLTRPKRAFDDDTVNGEVIGGTDVIDNVTDTVTDTVADS